MRLGLDEFLLRFLLHVLRGSMRIRHFGFLAPAPREVASPGAPRRWPQLIASSPPFHQGTALRIWPKR